MPKEETKTTETPAVKKTGFYVDGQEVSEKEWEKAASTQYDVSRLRELGQRPEIRTKRHGE
jgi:hypothetical protein